MCAAAVVAALAGVTVRVHGQAAAQPPAARHVIIVSIDGLRPAYYLPSPLRRAQMPVLDALRADGSWAEAVVGQYPSLTYPSHTSIATGVAPARHGIVHNTRFEPLAGTGSWYFENTAMTAPAIWDVARAAGLTTAGVSWPVTVGARIDHLYPESNQAPRDTTWLELARRESSPGLVDAVVERLGGFGPKDNLDYAKRDRFAAAMAAHIIERHRPNLMLVHLVETDTAQHSYGPDSPQTLAALRQVDDRLGEIVTATKTAGIFDRTTFIITGDHGFYRVHSALQPNVVLREAGLLETDAAGRIVRWQAAAHRAAIKLKDPGDRQLATRVERLFEELAQGRYRGIFRVVRGEELKALGADPEALLYLEPVNGYNVSDATRGDFLVASPRRGDHGYLPTSPEMHTGLILSGAGVLKGVVVPIARQLDIAPTAARLLGLSMANIDGVAIAGMLADLSTRPDAAPPTGSDLNGAVFEQGVQRCESVSR